MKREDYKWLLYAALGIALLILISLSLASLAWHKLRTAGDRDACHVIAGELAYDREQRPGQGKLPQATVDAIATRLIRGSVISGKLTDQGPRSGFGEPFTVLVDENGVTCFTGESSMTVPFPPAQ